MGQTITTEFLEVTSPYGVRMRCRLCNTEIYVGRPKADLDVDQMNAVMRHMFWLHEVSRQDLAADMQKAWDEGIRQAQEEHTK